MVNMTLAIPEGLHKTMKEHREIKWSEVARQALWQQASKLEIMDKLMRRSKFTEEDADLIGHKIKADILRRLLEKKQKV